MKLWYRTKRKVSKMTSDYDGSEGTLIHFRSRQDYTNVIMAFLAGGAISVTLTLMSMGWFNISTPLNRSFKQGQVSCLSGDIHYDLVLLDNNVYEWKYVPKSERWKLRPEAILMKTVEKEIKDLRQAQIKQVE